MPSLNTQLLSSVKIPIPPFAEQKKIAEILSTWDRAIALAGRLIAAKEQRKKALMQRLLTGRVRFREFGGEEWNAVQIKDIGRVVSGGTPSTANKKYWDGTINWCIPTDITKLKGHKFLGGTEKKISQLGYEKSSANLLPKNSVIVCTRATIGDCAINIVPMTTNQGFKSIIPHDIHFELLYYQMLTKKQQLLKLANGSTFSEVSKKDFENLSLHIPQSIPEQQKIAAVLQAADREIALLRQKRAALAQQKKGLMQVLLTGQVRVKIPNEPVEV
jgi:type I restriction enzyme S subunit